MAEEKITGGWMRRQEDGEESKMIGIK